MIELREVRARKISSPSSSLIFPPSRQKNRKTAIRGKRKNRNAKNTEIRVLVGVRHYMQATVGEYWDSWFSSISCSSQALFAHKKKLGKKTKNTPENTEKKKSTHETKKFPPPFSRPPPPPRRLNQKCARFMSSSWNRGKRNQNAHENEHAAPQKERGDCGAYLYNGGDRCERGLGHIGIIKPTGNGHVVVTRRPMYVKTVIVIHSIVKSQKVKTKFNYFLLLLTS